MADCKDCIKNDVCELYVHLHCKDYKENKCKFFKNKADFVEVVRCEDCKYYENGKSYTPYCNNVMNLFEEMKPDDFCSYGERK